MRCAKDDSKYIFHFTYDPDIVDGVLPAVSTYVFECSELKDVVAGEDVEANVTLKTAKLGRMGYTAVLFEFEKTEGSGDVTFTAVDSKGAKHTFTNSGTWGPPGGFELPAEYEAETDWILNFSRPGNYNITFKLVDLDNEGEVISVGSATVGVKAAGVITKTAYWGTPDNVLYYFDFELVAGVKIGDLESLVARAYDGENLLSTISLKEEKFEEYAGLTKLGGSFRSNPDLSPSSSWYLEAFDGTIPTRIEIEYEKEGKIYTFGSEDIGWINEGYKLVSNITKTKGYDTIQAAINDAEENDEISVGDGEFTERSCG